MSNNHEEKIGAFQILLVALSVYVLAAMAVEVVLPLSPQTRSILLYIDNAICVIFICDFFYRLFTASNKWHFLRWGWIDLLSSIPAVPAVRVGRAVRVIRVLRLLRGFRSAKTIGSVLFAHRAKGTLASAVFLCVLLIVFASVAILQVENDPNSNIRNPEDALWWSVVTVTTVGYGDKFPVTSEGRVLGIALMLAGVSLFAVFSGAFAAWFIDGAQEEDQSEEQGEQVLLVKQLAELSTEIKALRAELHCEDRIHR